MNVKKLKKRKPVSVYVFGSLFLFYYLLSLAVNILFIPFPNVIIRNFLFFTIVMIFIIIEILASLVLLIIFCNIRNFKEYFLSENENQTVK